MEAQPLSEYEDLVDRLHYKAQLAEGSLAILLREAAGEIARLRVSLDTAIEKADVRMLEIQRLERDMYRSYG